MGACMLPKNCGAAVWVAGAACSMLPDADTAAFRLGIAYSDVLGHRGLTHSLAFAALVSSAIMFIVSRNRLRSERLRIGLFLSVVTASHGVLDAFTNGGLGIAFFAPFSDKRFFFPVHPIEVSPIGAAFFSARGWNVLKSELVWVWVPTLAVVLAATAARARKR
jgi:inner membrane protein